jgi:putative flavoprotein involved in K+ transport
MNSTNSTSSTNSKRHSEYIQTVIIGAGQAGLSVGYHLSRRGLPFVILEANDRIGDVWRRRWDSLRLFTPAWLDSLDGWPFPAARYTFPTKDEMADYLEAYATRFQLPVRTGVRVARLSKQPHGSRARYVITTADETIEADHVIVAMASYQKPSLPAFARELHPDIVQLHSSEYRNPAQLRQGPALIVGAGNSGAEIAKDLTRAGHRLWVSGRDTGHLPFRIDGFVGRTFAVPLMLRVVFHRLLTLDTPMGRKARPAIISKGGPLIRVKPKDLAAAGVERVSRMSGVRDGLPVLDDGRVLEAANVIWCTGFHPGFSWIDLPIFDARGNGHGEPKHDRGVVSGEPGLYFVGLHFLYAMSSTMIHGVGRDAEHIANTVATRARATATASLRAVVQAKLA